MSNPIRILHQGYFLESWQKGGLRVRRNLQAAGKLSQITMKYMSKDQSVDKPDDFLFIAKVGTGLGFGFMIGTLWSLEGTPSGISFGVGLGSLISFVVGFIIALLYWKVVQRMLVVEGTNTAGSSRTIYRRRFAFFSLILLFIAFASFLYPVFRYTPAEKYKDIAFGLILAFIVVSGVAKTMWKLKSILDEDEKKNGFGKR